MCVSVNVSVGVGAVGTVGVIVGVLVCLRFGALVCWYVVMLVCWHVAGLVGWWVGVIECCCDGVLPLLLAAMLLAPGSEMSRAMPAAPQLCPQRQSAKYKAPHRRGSNEFGLSIRPSRKKNDAVRRHFAAGASKPGDSESKRYVGRLRGKGWGLGQGQAVKSPWAATKWSRHGALENPRADFSSDRAQGQAQK